MQLFHGEDFREALEQDPSTDEFLDEDGEFKGYEGRFEELCSDLSEYASCDDAISSDFWEAYSREVSRIVGSFFSKRH